MIILLFLISEIFKMKKEKIEGAVSALKHVSKIYSAIFSALLVSFSYYQLSKDLLMFFTLFNTLSILILPFTLFYYLLSFLRESATFIGSSEYIGYINPKCKNLEIVDVKSHNDIVYIHVKCKAKYLTKHGCPPNCPKLTTVTGAGTFVGGLVGGLVGLLGGPLGVLAGFLLGGVGGTILEGMALSPYEMKTSEYRDKKIVIVPHVR